MGGDSYEMAPAHIARHQHGIRPGECTAINDGRSIHALFGNGRSSVTAKTGGIAVFGVRPGTQGGMSAIATDMEGFGRCREGTRDMDESCLQFRFRWERVAPDKDDFLGSSFENEDLTARIYRLEEVGGQTWHWVVAVAGQKIGAGYSPDPRAAAHAAEDAYGRQFAVHSSG